MVSYKITRRRSVRGDFRKIDKQYIPRIIKKIESLAGNPRPEGCEKLKDAEQAYRIRIGDYRVIYHIDDQEKVILVYHVRHRKDAYRE